MSFLQPAILIGLPLVALPIIIHLINKRRFQTVQWAAMQFLLAAEKISKGWERIRRWLILAARTLAIAGLLFAISRPLSSGWLALAGGGRVDTTIILLDRSPSMQQRGASGVSKLQSAVNQLTASLGVIQSDHYVVIDSGGLEPIEIDSPAQLAELPQSDGVSKSADLPTMLEVANEYIVANGASRTEIWICSDVRKHDWKDEAGRWDAIRSSLLEVGQMVNIHLLAFPDRPSQNRSIRVTGARRVEDSEGARLLLSMRIQQTQPSDDPVVIPIQLELDGARSEFAVELSGTELELQDYAVATDANKTGGWGRVSIPSDPLEADNEFYFVYDKPIERKTVIVADDPLLVRPLEFAASISPDAEIVCSVEKMTPNQVARASLDTVSLVLWQAALPDASDPATLILESMLKRGGQVVFLPAESTSGESFAGIRWSGWQEHPERTVATWVGDQDLLAKTRSGQALPVGELKVNRSRGIVGDFASLASLGGGAPLLAQARTDERNVYFCCTNTSESNSSLARNGVVLYAIIHRSLAAGAESLGNTRQWIADEVAESTSGRWQRIAGISQALSSAYHQHAGVYQDEDHLFAINRSTGEDAPEIVPDERVANLFNGLRFDRVDGSTDSGASLVQEVWRVFLLLMLLALVTEAVLCIPRRPRGSAAINRRGSASINQPPRKSVAIQPQGVAV